MLDDFTAIQGEIYHFVRTGGLPLRRDGCARAEVCVQRSAIAHILHFQASAKSLSRHTGTLRLNFTM